MSTRDTPAPIGDLPRYLITVTQVGAKISVDKLTGDVTDVFAVSRRVGPGGACLKLQRIDFLRPASRGGHFR